MCHNACCRCRDGEGPGKETSERTLSTCEQCSSHCSVRQHFWGGGGGGKEGRAETRWGKGDLECSSGPEGGRKQQKTPCQILATSHAWKAYTVSSNGASYFTETDSIGAVGHCMGQGNWWFLCLLFLPHRTQRQPFRCHWSMGWVSNIALGLMNPIAYLWVK